MPVALSVTGVYSLGSLTSITFSTILRSFSLETNLYNSPNFSGVVLICLNRVEIRVPFLSHTQQCHGL